MRERSLSHDRSNSSGVAANDLASVVYTEERLLERRKKMMKVVVIFTAVLLLALAFGISLSEMLRQREMSIFTENYDESAIFLLNAVERRMEDKVWMAYTLSHFIAAINSTTVTTATSSSWPFTIITNFQEKTRGALRQAHRHNSTQMVAFSPWIKDAATRQEWYQFIQQNQHLLLDSHSCKNDTATNCRSLADGLYRIDPTTGDKVNDTSSSSGPFSPILQVAGATEEEEKDLILFNELSDATLAETLFKVHKTGMPALTNISTRTRNGLKQQRQGDRGDERPKSTLYYPIVLPSSSSAAAAMEVVGTVSLHFDWLDLLAGAFPANGPVHVVLSVPGELEFTFELSIDEAEYIGRGNKHEDRFRNDLMEISLARTIIIPDSNQTIEMADPLVVVQSSSSSSSSSAPGITVQVYPTARYHDHFSSNRPAVAGVLLTMSLIILGFVLLGYEFYTDKNKGHMYPESARDHVMSKRRPSFASDRRPSREFTDDTSVVMSPTTGAPLWKSFRRRGSHSEDNQRTRVMEPAQVRLRAYLNETGATAESDAEASGHCVKDEPIADIFPETTVMFADIQGFTAWSSEREPHQVFKLLETLYRAFDEEAAKLGVFKVDTIGDCYVAVAGLPDPNKYHAVVMAQFANECMNKMNDLIQDLEVKMGPGTADLSMRFGLHSGPVTAGVLRGGTNRFQLFGDSVNTASRMEHTGMPNRVHISEDTAQILMSSGKAHWISPRKNPVSVKGKGSMQTYWLTNRKTSLSHAPDQEKEEDTLPKQDKFGSIPSRVSPNEKWGSLNITAGDEFDANKRMRLVNWNVEVLSELLSKVVAWRVSREIKARRRDSIDNAPPSDLPLTDNGTVIDEVTEVITLPRFDEMAIINAFSDPPRLSVEVRDQLHDYVTCIANMYHNVPFHNLEHASHVTLSANKLMKRIISPGETDFKHQEEDGQPSKWVAMRRLSFGKSSASPETSKHLSIQKNLHESTFGIASDPLTQLAIVFSALIHDVDHTGLPNAQLVLEGQDIASRYNNKSVAEQNSVDIAWNLLMEPQYEALQQCIFGNERERRRFRQLVVNSVMATDIVDKELKQLRNNRWDKAFDETAISEPPTRQDINRKATIVIEHIIQASDVAHTMQHWHIYCKWNQKLFHEMYQAFLTGRAQKDPSVGWYEGEIWFFDNYIIPLAKKLKECGVFGVSSDEYLNYALENRREWELKGKVVCQTMMMSFRNENPSLVSATSRRGSEYSSVGESSREAATNLRPDLNRRDSNLSYSDLST